MLEDSMVSLPTLATVVLMSVTWAASIAGVYYGLRGRLSAAEQRMDRFKIDLDAGSARFAALDHRYQVIEQKQNHHGERIIVVETLLGSMNEKLDNILNEVKVHR